MLAKQLEPTILPPEVTVSQYTVDKLIRGPDKEIVHQTGFRYLMDRRAENCQDLFQQRYKMFWHLLIKKKSGCGLYPGPAGFGLTHARCLYSCKTPVRFAEEKSHVELGTKPLWSIQCFRRWNFYLPIYRACPFNASLHYGISMGMMAIRRARWKGLPYYHWL